MVKYPLSSPFKSFAPVTHRLVPLNPLSSVLINKDSWRWVAYILVVMKMMEFFVCGLFLSILDPKCWTWLESYESWHYSMTISSQIMLSKNFQIWFKLVSMFLWWYQYQFKKKLSKKVSVLVSKNFGIEKSIGIGFGKFWYRKKYRYRFRFFLAL